MQKLTLLTALLTFTVACDSGDKGGTDSNATSDTDTDGSGSDTDATSDTDTSGTGCGAFSGIVGLGTAWSYDYTGGDISGEYAVEVTAYDATSGELELTSDSTSVASGYETESTSVQQMSCSGGLYAESIVTTSVTNVAGTDYETVSTITYDKPVLIWPGSVSVGDTWTVTASGTTEVSGTSTPFSTTTDYEVTGEESVTVSAGTYTALVVEASSSGSTTTSWISLDVGTVKTASSELTSYTP